MNYLKKKSLLFVLIFLPLFALAQVVVTSPALPDPSDSVTVIFDATEGSAGLAGYTGDVYTHTGVVTNLSPTSESWRHVQGNWGTDDARVKMTPLGNDKYQIKYHIPTYYNVPSNETVQRLAFVFRNVDGSREGKGPNGEDLFVEVAQPNLSIVFSNPIEWQNVLDINTNLNISIIANKADTIRLMINGSEVAKGTGTSLSYPFQQSSSGSYFLEAIAEGNGNELRDTTSIYVKGSEPPRVAMPANWKNGVNYLNDSTVALVVYAPQKDYLFAMGSFNDWLLNEENLMKKTPDGNRYWLEITGLDSGKEYTFQYLVDGKLRIADPYTHKILDPWSDGGIPANNYPDLISYPFRYTSKIVSVFQINPPSYNWQVNNFQPPAKEDLIVYELLVRDFSHKDNFQFVLDSLDYLERLGVNAIEFMPVMEFENNDSWGYNPSFHMALDKYYGTPLKFKELIDSCHARGMAVILDIVPNHAFGQSPLVELYWDAPNNRPSGNSPWFNPVAKHDFNVGFDFNHESNATKEYMYRMFQYWLEEYHVDGYRLDLSKGLTQKNTLGNVNAWGQYDASRVAIIKDYADTIWSVNPEAYVILEHFADNSEEKVFSDYGMMLWGNANYNYNEGTMGYNENGKSDFHWISYQRRGWTDPHVMGYMESHDEERLTFRNREYGKSSGPYNIQDRETSIERIELAATFFFTIPGPKMVWQFGELAYDVSIDYNGRVGRKPIRWNYYQEGKRQHLYQVFASLAQLKKDEPAFKTLNFDLDVGGTMKTIHLNHVDMDVTVLGNFGVVTGNITPDFQSDGIWYEFFSGDSLQVTNTTAPLNLEAGEYRLYTTKKLNRSIITTGLEPLALGEDRYLSVFPNPSTGKVNLDFQLSKTEHVKIEILDASGRRLALLQDGQMAEGRQTMTFDIHHLNVSTGLYLLRLQAGSQQAVSKLILR